MILVTGGAGFIGSNLQAVLSAAGRETIVVDRLGTDGRWRNLARHPPEELYLALSSGAWRQELGPWFEPGPGGVVYNSTNILHGMHSGRAPQLALWCLPS